MERLVKISKQTLDERFYFVFEQPIETDVIYREEEDKWVLKFAMETSPFIFICTILKSDLLKQIKDSGEELTEEIVGIKFDEFRNKYLRYAIKEEVTSNAEERN